MTGVGVGLDVCVGRGVMLGGNVDVGLNVPVGGRVLLAVGDGVGVRVMAAVAVTVGSKSTACNVAVGSAACEIDERWLITHHTPTAANTITNITASTSASPPRDLAGGGGGISGGFSLAGGGAKDGGGGGSACGLTTSAGGSVTGGGGESGGGEAGLGDICSSACRASLLLGLMSKTFSRHVRRSASVSTAPLSQSQACSLFLSCWSAWTNKPLAWAFCPALSAAMPCFKRSLVSTILWIIPSALFPVKREKH